MEEIKIFRFLKYITEHQESKEMFMLIFVAWPQFGKINSSSSAVVQYLPPEDDIIYYKHVTSAFTCV